MTSTALTLEQRAQRITELQVGPTCVAKNEREICDLIVSTHGDELTHLKNLIDGGNDHQDFQKLIFDDIDNRKIREEILAHIRKQGELLRARSDYRVPLKILSDIDDTILVMIHDRKYPKGTVYPGAKEFYAALDASSPLIAVSARPRDPLGAIERHSHKNLSEAGFGASVVLSGSVYALRSPAAMGRKKVENFEEYSALFPEYDFLFTGDSGQGDVAFGEAIRQAYGDRVPAVFIHDVFETNGVKTDVAERTRYREQGIYFFDTHIGAAHQALKLGLITPEEASQIAAAVVADVAQMELSHVPVNVKSLIEVDLRALNLFLPEELRVGEMR